MSHKYSTEDFGFNIGSMKKGILNNICDVKGVTVGHSTVDTPTNKTGLTLIMPCEDNPFVNKPVAASAVLNGFGKTQGTVQIDELGTLETPIALTNTLNTGLVNNALVRYMIKRCENEGVEIHSVNPIVGECNDCTLNNIKNICVTEENFYEALDNLTKDFSEGDVGAGKGMICHGFKGGIGSASRIMKIGGKAYTLGVLVLSNHGKKENLIINGKRISSTVRTDEFDKGSCMIIMATDLPLSSRQIKRIIKRASVGLARLGSYIGNGSGEIAIGFTTANRMPWSITEPLLSLNVLNESLMEIPFVAMAETTEEAILKSMLCADSVTGYDGTVIESIREYL